MKFSTKKLKNGLTVVTVPQPSARTATVLVLVSVGSKYETKTENGLSHFLEHMCFKGTTLRPSAKIISENLESLGAVSNAFTSHEYTGYYTKGNPKHLNTFVDILSDIYLNSTFPAIEIEKEKGVIIEEINMYEDQPQQKVGEVLFELLYGDQSAGRSVLGTKETVTAFSRGDFQSYKERFYTAANTIVIVAGNITAEKAFDLIEKKFNVLPRSLENKKKKILDRQKTFALRVLYKKTDQSHFILAFRSVPLGHKDYAAMNILASVLGRGMSSRLFLLLREELGAAYYVRAEQESFTDHGLFAISAGITTIRLEEILKRIVKECNRLKVESVSASELAKAKEIAAAGLRLGLELSDDVAAFYGAQFVLRQKVRSPEAIITDLEAVSAADLKRVARKIFRSDRANLALIGPLKDADISRTIFKALD